MTCIIGLAQDGVCYLGGDSAAADSDTVVPSREPKVYRVGRYLVGDAGTWRAGQVLRFMEWPTYRGKSSDEAIHRHLCTSVADAIHGAMTREDLWRDGEWPGSLVVGLRGTVWSIAEDLGVHWPADPWVAVGSGALPALGSLHTSRGDPEKRIRRALEASAALTPTVAPPWVVRWL